MSHHDHEYDQEFEDFLKRRRPLFEPERGLEPPAELDRLVLRQAREAIRAEEPLPMHRSPRWAAPLAIAATLLVAVGVVFQVAHDESTRRAPSVTVEHAAHTGPGQALAPPPAAPPAAGPTPAADVPPAWRRSSETWLAEIQRLRAAGETARADAEMAEYNRERRAFAGSPDR